MGVKGEVEHVVEIMGRHRDLPARAIPRPSRGNGRTITAPVLDYRWTQSGTLASTNRQPKVPRAGFVARS
jgi:hypothetical protein